MFTAYTCIMRGSTQLHDIIRSEAYSEEEFLAAVEHLGMNWYAGENACVYIVHAVRANSLCCMYMV